MADAGPGQGYTPQPLPPQQQQYYPPPQQWNQPGYYGPGQAYGQAQAGYQVAQPQVNESFFIIVQGKRIRLEQFLIKYITVCKHQCQSIYLQVMLCF